MNTINNKKIELINKMYYNYIQFIDMGILFCPTIKSSLYKTLTPYSIPILKNHLNKISTLTPNQIITYLNTI